MGLKSELEKEVAAIFRAAWQQRDGEVVPDDSDLKLSNDAVNLAGAVLYADLADSTRLVDRYKPHFAAEIYKTFLHCAARIIRSDGGEISAYDGDRIMAVFIGDSKETSAVRAALKINYASRSIINRAQEAQYPESVYRVRHAIGIDTSDLFIARTGIRGANDLVWVGRAANYAAKLSALPAGYVYITKEVYAPMDNSVAFSDGKPMWEQVKWNTLDDRLIYRCNWTWTIA